MNISRRSFLAGATIAGLGLAGCGSSQVGESEKDTTGADTTKAVYDMTPEEEEEAWKKEPRYGSKIQLGWSGGLCTAQLGVATKKGFYEDEGLDVELVKVGTTSVADGVGAGKMDVTSDHIATLLVPATNDVPITFTLGLHIGCKSLYVLNDSEYKSTADLKGKTIGLPDGIGNSDQNISFRFFGRDGIDPTTEVNWKPVEASACVQALQNDEIQGALLGDLFAEKFVAQGILRYIRSITWDDDFKKEPCCILTFNRTFIKENPVTAKKFTRAVQKAGQWVHDNNEEALQIMLDNEWATGEEESLLKYLKAFGFVVSEQQTKDSLLDIITDYKKYGIIDNPESAEDILASVWAPVLGNVK
jgi:NitT/TauT family transport system substrate-binding protein